MAGEEKPIRGLEVIGHTLIIQAKKKSVSSIAQWIRFEWHPSRVEQRRGCGGHCPIHQLGKKSNANKLEGNARWNASTGTNS